MVFRVFVAPTNPSKAVWVKFMKVLLVQPDSFVASRNTPAEYRYFCEPIALEYIAAESKSRGHEVDILDMRVDPVSLASRIKTFAPDVVGTTGYSVDYGLMLDICSTVRSVQPDAKIVIGGHHASWRPWDFFKDNIDFVVVGEGIDCFNDLLTALETGGALSTIEGLWYRSQGDFIGGLPVLKRRDLRSLSVPDRALTRPFRAQYGMGTLKNMASIRTSEGCPYRCSFCTIWRAMDGRYFQRAGEAVAEELSQIEEKGVFLIDDEPWIGARKMGAVQHAIETSGIKKNYVSYCRIDSINKHQSLLEAWQRIGMHVLLVGIEAVTSSELDEYNKGYKNASVKSALDFAKAQGLIIQGLFIIHPDWGYKEFETLRRFIERHDIQHPTFTVLTPLPGTPTLGGIGDHVTARMDNGDIDWSQFDLLHPVTKTKLPIDVFHNQVQQLFGYYNPIYWPDEVERPLLPRMSPSMPNRMRAQQTAY